MKKFLKYSVLLAILSVISFFSLVNKPVNAAPQTIVVNSAGDKEDSNFGDGICATIDGECTLRAAIETANNNNNPSDQDVIEFNIAPLDGGVKTINQSSETVSQDAAMVIKQNVLIDGFTQDNASANTADFPNPFNGTTLIEISGDGYHNYAPSLRFDPGSAGSEVRGINFSDFPGVVILIDDEDIKVRGNYINTTSNGNGANYKSNSDENAAIIINSPNVVIGGNLPEYRNVFASNNAAIAASENADNLTISGNNMMVGSDGVTPLPAQQSLVQLYGADNVIIGGSTAVEGNLIENSATGSGISISNESTGVTIKGNSIVGNQYGISIFFSDDITIGGSGDDESNVISGNDSHGLNINNSTNVSVFNNFIGVTSDGSTSLPNTSSGIYLDSSTNIEIGSTNESEANIIANNGDDGVTINGTTSKASVLINSIYNNGDLGIDIYNNGVSANDENDPDSGPNDILNFPRLYEPVVNGSDLDVEYELDVPAGDYLILFYSNASADGSGNGEGQTYIGSQSVTSLGSGTQQFSTTLTGNSHTNVFATASLVDSGNMGQYIQTSEFGDQTTPPPPPTPVTDIVLEKTLLNPEDLAQGATLNYALTYTNNGPDSLDLTEFSDVGLGVPLLYDYIEPDFTPINDIADGPIPGTKIIDVGNSDLVCLWAGPGSFGLYFGETSPKYSQYSLMACWYVGVNPELASASSLALSVSLNVAGDSDLALVNFAYAPFPTNSIDPSIYNLEGDSTLLNLLSSANVNNFAFAQLPQDINVNSEVLNPDQITAGGEVQYQITLTNAGENSIDLSHYFNISSNSLASFLFDGSNLSFIDTSDPNISCTDLGEGSIAFMGPAGLDHSGYQFAICQYDPEEEYVVQPDQSFSFTLNFTINQLQNFSMYSFQGSAFQDPDLLDLYNEVIFAEGDILDSLENNNYSRVAVTFSEQNSGGDSSGQNNTNNGSIANTGDSTALIIAISVILVLSAIIFTVKAKRSKTS